MRSHHWANDQASEAPSRRSILLRGGSGLAALAAVLLLNVPMGAYIFWAGGQAMTRSVIKPMYQRRKMRRVPQMAVEALRAEIARGAAELALPVPEHIRVLDQTAARIRIHRSSPLRALVGNRAETTMVVSTGSLLLGDSLKPLIQRQLVGPKSQRQIVTSSAGAWMRRALANAEAFVTPLYALSAMSIAALVGRSASGRARERRADAATVAMGVNPDALSTALRLQAELNSRSLAQRAEIRLARVAARATHIATPARLILEAERAGRRVLSGHASPQMRATRITARARAPNAPSAPPPDPHLPGH